jgi:hypothetical protein
MKFRLLATVWLLCTAGSATNTTTAEQTTSIGIADHINHGLGIEASSPGQTISSQNASGNDSNIPAETTTRSKDMSSAGWHTTQLQSSSASTEDRYAFTLDTQNYGPKPSFPPFTLAASGSGMYASDKYACCQALI